MPRTDLICIATSDIGVMVWVGLGGIGFDQSTKRYMEGYTMLVCLHLDLLHSEALCFG